MPERGIWLSDAVVWLQKYLRLDEQQELAARCREFIDGPAGGYVPTGVAGERCECG